MPNEKVSIAWDGWKDLHTWSSDDSFYWALPETITSEHIALNHLPDVVGESGFSLPSMMLITSIFMANNKGVKLDNALTKYADEQVSLSLAAEKSHPSEHLANKDWLWNLRQFGVKNIPQDFGIRDLTDGELYEFQTALQHAGVHPLRYFDARTFSKVLRAYSPELVEPHDLGAKFIEREAFINTLLYEPALEQIANNESLLVTVRESNEILCREVGKDLPTKNKVIRSSLEDKVSLRVMGAEEGQIFVTPPEKVEQALTELALINAKWQNLPAEEKSQSAKKHFIKMWAGITTIQPLSHQNNRLGFIVAHQLTKRYTDRQLPKGAFMGSLSVKSEFELYRNERYRDPVTLSPTEEALEIISNKLKPEWVNQSQFAEGIRSSGFIRERPWVGKLKWRI